MPNYKKTIIYRMPVGNKNYYGHTTQPLHKRRYGHQQNFHRHPNTKVYKAMREAGMTVDDIELIWVEDYPCDNVNQAKAREKYWVERNGSLNAYAPITDFDNKREYMRQKRAEDETFRRKENERQCKKNRERVKCDACGKEMCYGAFSRHKLHYCRGINQTPQ